MVPYSLYDNASSNGYNIPVAYEVQQEGNREIYKCSIDLPEHEIPEWLTVRDFEIPTVHERGVNTTHFSEVKGMHTIDTMLFVTRVYQSISLLQMLGR